MTATVWKTVTASHLNSDELIASAKARGYRVTGWGKDVLSLSGFDTAGSLTYSLSVIRGDECPYDRRTFDDFIAEAARRGYGTPPPEVALLLAQLDYSELGVRSAGNVIVMHDPIDDREGRPVRLWLGWLDGSGGELGSFYSGPASSRPFQFSHLDLFVFLAPQDAA
jgi:hypothetical protein